MNAARQGSVGATRICPHCKATVLVSANICPGCQHHLRFNAAVTDPIFALSLRNDAGHTVFATDTSSGHGPTGSFAAGATTVVRMRFENWLTAGRYSLGGSVARNGRGDDKFDLREDVASLVVHGDPSELGIARLPHGFELERR